MSDDLKTLFPGTEITVGEDSLTVVPFKFGQLAAVTKLLKPIIKALVEAEILSFSQEASEVKFSVVADWLSRILDVMDLGGEDLLSLTALAVGKPREWLDKIEADDGVLLLKTVIEVNAGFFTKRVLPRLGVNLAEASTSDGEVSSNSSLPTGTGEPTSTDTP